ncbi:ParB/RepB/Spo0J family partition protein [Comamonas terrigena]|uniref:ParB/RepB/Spo0J family partition protein n=1 Tax=Comamonas terrigena TaxID=32013 RepID=UPI0023559DA2|nr:ParB/RepB/Spo0J family partition protein [Comamonas terrigena]
MTDAHDTITHAIPAAGAGAGFGHLLVLSIARSLTNPREHFDPDKLQELADSIKATGVHTPVLVRPLPASRVADELAWAKTEQRERAQYELVAGERRWRACQLAGVTEIPAMIRDMTDAQALEAQVIENLQREDISRLEEAKGYRKLMEETGRTAEEIGAMVGKGKSRAYIYSVLKVLDLCDEGQQALRQGELDFSSALAISRIATKDLQREALEWVSEGWGDDKPSAREVQVHVKREYMLDLRKAPFSRKDAELCPAAGACATCPSRTGADQDDDSKGADVCTNPPCYRAKEQAHADQLRKQAQERGCDVLDEKQSIQLVGNYYSEYQSVPGYKRLDNQRDCPIEGKTLRKAIGAKVMEQSGIKPTLITNPNNTKELIHCITTEQAQQLLQMAGHAEAEEKLIEEAKERDRRDADNARKQAQEEYERAWRLDVLQGVVKHLQQQEKVCDPVRTPSFNTSNRLAAQRLAGQLNGDDSKLLCKLLDLGKVVPKEAIKQAANDWSNPELLTGCIIALHDRGSWDAYDHDTGTWAPRKNPELFAMAEACGVDVEAAKAKAQANMRAAEAEKAAAATESTGAPKTDLPLTPAARDSAGGKGGKAKNQKGPAARAAGGVGKLDAAAATASIAAALQALPGEPEPGAAVAAQGDEAGPVAAEAAQAPVPLVKLKRSKLAPPAADTPASKLQAASADDGQDGADEKAGAAASKPLTPETRADAVGKKVRVLSTVSKKLRTWIGEEGKALALMGDRAVLVEFPAAPRCKPQTKSFDASELEAIE